MTENKTDMPATGIEQPQASLPLGRTNFILMAICGIAIVLGFVLMLGSSHTGDTFNADIYSTRRIAVGPTIAIIGFIGMAFAIIYNRRKPLKNK